MSHGTSGLCRHVWVTKCRTCGTDIKHWPELNTHVDNICKRWDAGRATEEEILFLRHLALSAARTIMGDIEKEINRRKQRKA